MMLWFPIQLCVFLSTWLVPWSLSQSCWPHMSRGKSGTKWMTVGVTKDRYRPTDRPTHECIHESRRKTDEIKYLNQKKRFVLWRPLPGKRRFSSSQSKSFSIFFSFRVLVHSRHILFRIVSVVSLSLSLTHTHTHTLSSGLSSVRYRPVILISSLRSVFIRDLAEFSDDRHRHKRSQNYLSEFFFDAWPSF